MRDQLRKPPKLLSKLHEDGTGNTHLTTHSQTKPQTKNEEKCSQHNHLNLTTPLKKYQKNQVILHQPPF